MEKICGEMKRWKREREAMDRRKNSVEKRYEDRRKIEEGALERRSPIFNESVERTISAYSGRICPLLKGSPCRRVLQDYHGR